MKFTDAIPYVSFVADNTLSFRTLAEAQASESMPRWKDCILVGWQCGFEPLFVAVHCYMDCPMDDDEAVELATDGLEERNWFNGETREPDYIIRSTACLIHEPLS